MLRAWADWLPHRGQRQRTCRPAWSLPTVHCVLVLLATASPRRVPPDPTQGCLSVCFRACHGRLCAPLGPPAFLSSLSASAAHADCSRTSGIAAGPPCSLPRDSARGRALEPNDGNCAFPSEAKQVQLVLVYRSALFSPPYPESCSLQHQPVALLPSLSLLSTSPPDCFHPSSSCLPSPRHIRTPETLRLRPPCCPTLRGSVTRLAIYTTLDLGSASPARNRPRQPASRNLAVSLRGWGAAPKPWSFVSRLATWIPKAEGVRATPATSYGPRLPIVECRVRANYSSRFASCTSAFVSCQSVTAVAPC